MTPLFVVTLGDVISLVTLALVFIVVGTLIFKELSTQRRCKHDRGVNETNSCDAICRSCGKNLGFIDKYRKPKEPT
jgi:hypothetical protein